MRISAGSFKGQLLQMPKGIKIRPTSQMVKQAVFDILGDVRGCVFLELFAGSGSVGIEALSRGAKGVVFIDNDRRCLRAIAANLKRLGIPYSQSLSVKKTALLGATDALEAVDLLARWRCQFDIVFLDPPYQQDILKNCLIKISRCDILKSRSLVIAEHSRREILPQKFSTLNSLSSRKYGDSTLSFYQNEAQDE